jgi:hypothetical protein
MTDELPDVDRTDTHSGPSATAYFTNGAKLRYVRRDDGIYEEVFAPSDPHSVMESSFITSQSETPAHLLSESLAMYEEYETVDELQRDWSSLAEWIVHE